jgi:hypothetical protein
MIARRGLAAVLMGLLGAFVVPAADKDEPREKKEDRAAYYERISQGPSGVRKTEIEKDDKGRVTSILIVGKADISTVLGLAKGIRLAEKRAVNDAKGAFLKWLEEEASVRETEDNETVVMTEGAKETGKDAGRKETGKEIAKSTTEFKTASAGLLRGLQVVYYNQDGKGKLYTVVLRYTSKAGDAARSTKKDLDTRAPEEKKPTPEPGTGKPEPKKEGTKPAPEKKGIPDKKGVVDD